MGELLLNVLFPLYFLIGLGYLMGKVKPNLETATISFLVLYLFAPALIFYSFRHLSVSLNSFACVAGVALIVFLGVLALSVAAEKLFLKRRDPAFELSATVMNAGYLGIPFIYLMFGEKALPYAVSYMVVMAVYHFTLGIVVLSLENLKEGIKSALKIPLIYAALLAFVTKGVPLPDGVEKTLKLTGDSTMPLMLVSIGVSLSKVKASYLKEAVIATAVRFLGGTAVSLSAVLALKCPQELRWPVVVQSSLPSAILNFVLCEKFNKNPQTAASVIFVSTLLFPAYALFLKWLMDLLSFQ
jgi:predicted permease